MSKTSEAVTQELEYVIGTILSVERRSLKTNLQKVLYSLLRANGRWVPRNAFRVPSATSRLRDLRKESYGEFPVECLVRPDKSENWTKSKPSYYRLKEVDVSELRRLFGHLFTE